MTGPLLTAVYAVALGPDCEPMRRADRPDVPLFDYAVAVVAAARACGQSLQQIAGNPKAAVEAARGVFAKIDAADAARSEAT